MRHITSLLTKVLLAVFLLCSGAAQAKDYVVKDKAYFYDVPVETTRRNDYLVAGDTVTAITEKDGFVQVKFTNPQTQRTTRGWLKLWYLKATSTIELRTEHIDALNKILRNTKYYAKRSEVLSFIEKEWGKAYVDKANFDRDIGKCVSEQDYSYVIRGKYLFVDRHYEEFCGGFRPDRSNTKYIIDLDSLSVVSQTGFVKDFTPALKNSFKKLIIESLQYLINTKGYDKNDYDYNNIGDDGLLKFNIQPDENGEGVLLWWHTKWHPNYQSVNYTPTMDVLLTCKQVERFLTDKGREIFCGGSNIKKDESVPIKEIPARPLRNTSATTAKSSATKPKTTAAKSASAHLQFMGIPIDGHIDAFVAKLQQKGFVKIRVNDAYEVIMKGPFMGEQQRIVIGVTSRSRTVYSVQVGSGEERDVEVSDIYESFNNEELYAFGVAGQLYGKTAAALAIVVAFMQKEYPEYTEKYGEPTISDGMSYLIWQVGNGTIMIGIATDEILYDDALNTQKMEREKKASILNDI